MAMIREERELKLTYQAKESTRCPICDTRFNREELLSGGGRLIAGPLTDELHRLYEPSAKYGEVYPLLYQPTVCPSCWFASLDADFPNLPAKFKDDVMEDHEALVADVEKIFPSIDFSVPRGLHEGAAANYLALRCYHFYPKDFNPTLKGGICALRTGWIFDIMHQKEGEENWDWLSTLFKQKALFLYREALALEQMGKEALSGMRNFGPDTDKNFGYDGLVYLSALLEFKYGQREDGEKRIAAIDEAKRTIAKLFGLGKSSKNKPGPLLEVARDLYDSFNRELNQADD